MDDVRWKQRFDNYKKAFGRLKEAVNYSNNRDLNELEQQGLVKAFEFTFELAWKVMKDYLESMGITDIVGSKGTVREAFKNGLISEGQIWIDMIADRNLSSHTYDEKIKNVLIKKMIDIYYKEFLTFEQKMTELSEE